jgi:NADP-reducing hydrogenase subunit HndB
MGKVKTLDDLRKLRNDLKTRTSLPDKSVNFDDLIQVKVAMATCCIASGSRDTMNYLADELEKRNIEAIVTQTGCMGYCYAEPTIEITVQGKDSVVFGYVDEKKANEIIEKYIKGGELVEGIIPVNYRNINDTNK